MLGKLARSLVRRDIFDFARIDAVTEFNLQENNKKGDGKMPSPSVVEKRCGYRLFAKAINALTSSTVDRVEDLAILVFTES